MWPWFDSRLRPYIVSTFFSSLLCHEGFWGLWFSFLRKNKHYWSLAVLCDGFDEDGCRQHPCMPLATSRLLCNSASQPQVILPNVTINANQCVILQQYLPSSPEYSMRQPALAPKSTAFGELSKPAPRNIMFSACSVVFQFTKINTNLQ